uniref:Venom peptide HtC2Tx4 n=1 Tax=Hadogenes troglodytes TaxID=1577150 RepID=A0A1B3IIZ8_9SCOR|nr:venom peptide HtC2Tx4 [Hadogenes troglodytes]
MKTLPVIFLCLLVLLAATPGIWSREEGEHEPSIVTDGNCLFSGGANEELTYCPHQRGTTEFKPKRRKSLLLCV